MQLSRRTTLLGLAVTGALGRVRYALANTPGQKRFIVVLQRGALDGMSAMVPYGDANLALLRPALIPPAPGQPGGMFDLGGFYGLSPYWPNMASMYQAGELLPIHAVAGPYRTRSHFEAQDLLQLGGAGDDTSITSGWLNRALAELPHRDDGGQLLGLAAGIGTPLLLQGQVQTGSYAPDHFASPSPDLMSRIAALNANDKLLSPAIAEGMQEQSFDKSVMKTAALPQNSSMPAPMPGLMGPDGGMAPSAGGGSIMSDDRAHVPGDAPKIPGGFPVLAAQIGRLLAAPNGPRIAVFQLEGWDTHGNQMHGLKAPMTGLDAGMQSLKTALGPAWAQTCVLIITEFGRTARMNGTKGTDHGTAAAAFALGGAVQGGRVVATWPGLAPNQLFQNRDLAPTLDIRAVAKGALAQHLGLGPAALARVFPDSGSAAPLNGMIRTA
jgi:uncharacterized protein (DUF1501 family)